MVNRKEIKKNMLWNMVLMLSGVLKNAILYRDNEILVYLRVILTILSTYKQELFCLILWCANNIYFFPFKQINNPHITAVVAKQSLYARASECLKINFFPLLIITCLLSYLHFSKNKANFLIVSKLLMLYLWALNSL